MQKIYLSAHIPLYSKLKRVIKHTVNTHNIWSLYYNIDKQKV